MIVRDATPRLLSGRPRVRRHAGPGYDLRHLLRLSRYAGVECGVCGVGGGGLGGTDGAACGGDGGVKV